MMKDKQNNKASDLNSQKIGIKYFKTKQDSSKQKSDVAWAVQGNGLKQKMETGTAYIHDSEESMEDDTRGTQVPGNFCSVLRENLQVVME